LGFFVHAEKNLVSGCLLTTQFIYFYSSSRIIEKFNLANRFETDYSQSPTIFMVIFFPY